MSSEPEQKKKKREKKYRLLGPNDLFSKCGALDGYIRVRSCVLLTENTCRLDCTAGTFE